ncbi:hypothetical protein AB0I49_20770 [Streptomyces sp. NPDC050617]|uniref:hypothetical protein n=1 Tax=Streptomyces sp. NPDC050617 TaxID=3154628 RepID=UPI00341DBAFA
MGGAVIWAGAAVAAPAHAVPSAHVSPASVRAPSAVRDRSAVGASASVRASAAVPAAACRPNTEAAGLASRPLDGSLVSVPRRDGRVEQFQYFADDSVTQGLPWFLWHRAQDEPGGAYGDWERVSAVPIGPKISYASAAEDADGRLEAFFPSYGVFCHTAQAAPDAEDWSPAADFGLNPAPYHGGVVLFATRDGRLHAFASSAAGTSSMNVRSQGGPSGAWGPVRSMGKVPDANVGLGAPGSLTELADGRLRVGAREWNRDRTWQTTELTPGGSWEPWRLCPTAACA